MPSLAEMLHDAVGDLDHAGDDFDLERLAERATARRRRRHRRRVTVGAAVAVVLLAVVAVGLVRRDQGPRVRTGPADGTGFSSPTDAVLFFDDGYDGVTIVDVDRGIAVRHPGLGQVAGDQPFRIRRVEDRLVVGWGEIYSAPLGVGPSRLLGEATIFVPAAEPDRVWLVDYPGGAVGGGRLQVRTVDMSGRVLLDVPGPENELGTPVIGVPGGLALVTGSGLNLWNATTGDLTHLGQGASSALDVDAETLAWCDDGCTKLQLTDVSEPDAIGRYELTVHLDAYGSITSAELAPDGRHVAVTLAPNTPDDGETSVVVVIDAATGESTPVTETAGAYAPVAWSPDSRSLFLASDSSRVGKTDLGRYSLAGDSLENVTLPFGGLGDFVVADRAETDPLPNPTATAEECPPPTVQPSGRTRDCTVGFDTTPTNR